MKKFCHTHRTTTWIITLNVIFIISIVANWLLHYQTPANYREETTQITLAPLEIADSGDFINTCQIAFANRLQVDSSDLAWTDSPQLLEFQLDVTTRFYTNNGIFVVAHDLWQISAYSPPIFTYAIVGEQTFRSRLNPNNSNLVYFSAKQRDEIHCVVKTHHWQTGTNHPSLWSYYWHSETEPIDSFTKSMTWILGFVFEFMLLVVLYSWFHPIPNPPQSKSAE